MTDCEFLQKCLFFNGKLENKPTASDVMKKMYCRWNHTKCARYIVVTTLGKSAIPHDMFPSDHRRANEMLIQYDIK